MATSKTVIAAEFQFESGEAKKRVSELKQELNAAKNQVVALSDEFGASSIQAINAAKSVAKLKGEINDANQLTASFNPEKKFSNLSSAITGVISGFELYQGGLALIGQQSEESEKVIAKLNAIMALKDGYEGVTESISAFKRLGGQLMQFSLIQKIVTGAQYLWNAAMAANPIGAIVAVVAALIAGIVALTAWLIKSSDAAKQNAAQIKESAKALEEQKKSADRAADALKRNTDYTLEMLKASGATTAEIRNAERALAAKAVVEARTTFQVAAHTREIESQRLAQMKANGATEENIKAQTENLNKYTENLNEQAKRFTTAKQDELNLIAKQNVQIRQEQTTANQKAAEKRQEDVDNAKKKAEERAKANADADKQILSAKQQNTLAMIKDENDRAKIAADYDLENKTNEINALNISNERKKELIRLAEEENRLVIKGINDKIAEDKKKKDADDLAKSIDTENQRSAVLEQIRLNGITNEFQKKQAILADQNQKELDQLTDSFNKGLLKKEEYEKAKSELESRYKTAQATATQENADKEAKTEEDLQAKKLATKRKALDDLQAIFGTETAMGRAVLLAKQALAIQEMIQSAKSTLFKAKDTATKATMDAAGAQVSVAAGAAKTSSYVPFPANIPLIIGYAAQAVGIIAAIRSALRGVKGAGGGGVTMPSTAAGTAPVITPQAQTTRLEQSQINQIGNAAVRSYVLESDVSSNQERITRLNRAARIN